MLILIGKNESDSLSKLYNIKVAYGESKICQFHTTAEVTNYYVVPYKGIQLLSRRNYCQQLEWVLK